MVILSCLGIITINKVMFLEKTALINIDEYWFEDLNLRGGYKKVILDYIKSNYAHLYPIYEDIYIRNKKDALTALDQEITQFCTQNNINFKAYFHHEEVMKSKEKVQGRGNNKFVQTSLFN